MQPIGSRPSGAEPGRLFRWVVVTLWLAFAGWFLVLALWTFFQEMAGTSTLVGPAGSTRSDLLRNWGMPDAIFARREGMFDGYFVYAVGEDRVRCEELPPVPYQAWGYRTHLLECVVVYLDRTGAVTAVYRGDT